MRGILFVAYGDGWRAYLFDRIEMAREVSRLLSERQMINGSYVVPFYGRLGGSDALSLAVGIERGLSDLSDGDGDGGER